MKIIDLRSDTVTQPTQNMRDAMHVAVVGDDVFQEDPTIIELEKKSAQLLGKEAGLFVASGTMGNIISFLVHCPRGTEALLGDKSHTFLYEAGGFSVLGGIHSHQLKNNDDGTIDIESIKSGIRKNNIHFPRTSLISLENTHNVCFGTPLTVHYIDQVSEIAKENNVKIHMDGARLFNAAIALNANAHELVQNVDSVSFCLSKGLSAPVGSVLCGTENFIFEARKIRKLLGGGMRQGGIIASAGILSLTEMISRLKFDHKHAKKLAAKIHDLDGLNIDLNKVKSNILYFNINPEKMSGSTFLNKLAEQNIKLLEINPNQFRIVTHSGISTEDVQKVIALFETIFSN